MTVYFVFVLSVATLGVMALGHPWPIARYGATALVVLLACAAPAVYFDLLSHPKLLTDETRADREVEVLAYSAIEGVAVYYWLRLPGVGEPRYYYEEWSEAAKKRLEAMEAAREEGQRTGFLLPFEPSLNKDKKVHPLPQPRTIPKPAPESPGRQFSI